MDGSRFHEFKARYGPTLVCGFARWMGHRGRNRREQWRSLLGSRVEGRTLRATLRVNGAFRCVFLQNITGFMVGREYEARGIIKDGAKMVQAVATAEVPKFTVIIGASHGAGNYAMCGRGYGPRFLFVWPNARISVMGAQQAAQVLVTVKQQQRERDQGKLSEEERAGCPRRSSRSTNRREVRISVRLACGMTASWILSTRVESWGSVWTWLQRHLFVNHDHRCFVCKRRRMNSLTSISVELRNGIARVTLNRPDRRNAFDQRMVDELHHVFEESQRTLK